MTREARLLETLGLPESLGSPDHSPPVDNHPGQKLKQAVVLVHGMGEQVPMQTLRGFVETMWVRDPGIDARRPDDPAQDGNPIWWKPDPTTGSFELSRITTRAGHSPGNDAAPGPRTDFFEFYWADLTSVNTLEQLKDWFMSLLWRLPSQVPRDVWSAWVVLWLFTAGFGFLALWQGAAFLPCVPAMPAWASKGFKVAVVVYTVLIGFVLATFGDVAHYVRAKPPNIAARGKIRQRGLALLRSISRSGRYDRIVLVGHSLGSIIAYDLIKLLWSELNEAHGMTTGDPLHQAYLDCQAAAVALRAKADPDNIRRYRDMQQKVFLAMQGRVAPDLAWLISDFVTVGSPLAHAQFLMERDAATLALGIAERRYPTSPPVFEGQDGFLYRPLPSGQPERWQAHHAAPFASVRWTNIYDPASCILWGDLISGPVGPNFGPGIVDEPVTIRRSTTPLLGRLFTHTAYWMDPGERSPQLSRLRKALDLLRG